MNGPAARGRDATGGIGEDVLADAGELVVGAHDAVVKAGLPAEGEAVDAGKRDDA